MLIGQSPFPWRLAIRFFKGPGKMQLAGITHTCTDFSDGKIGRLHVFACFSHPETDQEFLGRYRKNILEDFAEIASV